MKPDYGIDAPYVIRNFLLIALAWGAAVAAGKFWLLPEHPVIARYLIGYGWSGVFWCLLWAGIMYGSSKVGKLWLRDRVLDGLAWRGDETVLDVGCGSGMMVIGAAKRAPRGKAIGIDVWHTEDQTASNPEIARRNAEIEGVADRVEIRDGDAREIPFADGHFDTIVSCYCIHNIYDPAGRTKAIQEIARVLKPGGCVAIIDIRHTRDYVKVLQECGLIDVRRNTSIIVFGLPSRYVTGRKPPL